MRSRSSDVGGKQMMWIHVIREPDVDNFLDFDRKLRLGIGKRSDKLEAEVTTVYNNHRRLHYRLGQIKRGRCSFFRRKARLREFL